MLGPVIEGERIRLEPPRAEHLATYGRWFEDMEVTRYLLYRNPFTHKGEAEWLERTAADEKGVIWAILARTSGRVVGTTALHDINWRSRYGMTGIVIGEKDEWGKGYAGEAMRLRTRYAFRELGLQSSSPPSSSPMRQAAAASSAPGTASAGSTGATFWPTGNGTTCGSGKSSRTTGKPRRGAHEAAAAGDAL